MLLARRLVSPLCVAAALVGSLALAACQSGTPTPARTAAPSPAVAARATAAILDQFGGRYANPALHAYVAQVGHRVLAVTPMAGASVEFVLLDTDMVNAFAVPGATIFVTRGMLTWLNSEAELAGVIAHELGHLTEQHIARARVAERQAEDKARARGLLTLDEDLEAELLAYSRNQELDADRAGLGYLVAAGYPGTAMAGNLHQFEQVEMISGLERGQTTPLMPHDRTMATHPPSAERIAALGRLPDARSAGDDRRASYLAAIAGVPFGPRPDDWQVSGRQVVHSGIGIAFTLPPGYTMAASAGILSGTGPEDSALIVDYDSRHSSTTPAAYLNRQFGHFGSEPAQTQLIGDFPMAAIDFEEDEDGEHWRIVLGTVAVRDDVLMRVMSIANTAHPQVVDATFDAVIESVHRSSGRPVGSPPVIAVHQIQPGETARSLARQMATPAAAAPYAEALLRAINGMAPGDAVAPGDLIKLLQ